MEGTDRKAFREQVKADVKAERAERRRIRSLRGEDRSAAKAAVRQARADRKAEVAAMSGAEKRAAKKHDRMVSRRVHWLRTILSRVAALLVLVVAAAGTAAYMLVGSLAGRALTAGFDLEFPAAIEAQDASREVVTRVEGEGIVLLQNDASVLPLAQGTKLNLFGTGSVASVFGGGGSGSADTSKAMTLQQGLEAAGFEVNPTLVNLYTNWANNGIVSTEDAGAVDTSQERGLEQTTGTTFSANELDPASLTEDIMGEAKDFSDTAVVVISRTGSEGSDLPVDYLKLSAEERGMVEQVCSSFDHVVVLVNTASVMELGWVEEFPQIQGVLWIGPVGQVGMEAVGQVLAGAINPSGRTVDTFAYDLMDNPANLMIGNASWLANEYQYEGLDNAFFINYYEGIYVGYRYFETAGADGFIDYGQTVQYPFGYGLSYTTFDRELLDVTSDGDQVTMRVRVTNAGDVAGKDVVQAYFSAPYTPGGVEKSAVELAAFAKTELLEPGASQEVELSWPVRDMASFDASRGAYVLDAGTYEVSLRSDSHTVVASKSIEIASEVIYDTDEATGSAITARFDGADGGIQVLSRADWASTWPSPEAADLTAPEDAVANHTYVQPAPAEVDYPVTGAKNGIMLSDLAGLDYDDPMWDAFLDQLTVKEMADQIAGGGYGTAALNRLGVPFKRDMDGPAAVNNVWAGTSGVQFPAEIVIGSTWNVELAAEVGTSIATEARAYDVVGWYAPGANLHRSALGGRTFEYFSEDPLLSGMMAASEIAAAEEQGVVCYLKHFALNEQENNRNNNGLYTWANEQTIRELYLRPFEIAVKLGEPAGMMSSFNRIGSVWSGGTRALLVDVLRGEWGFHGVVVSDATNMVFWPYMNQAQGVLAGNDLFLDYGANYDSMVLAGQARNNPELQQAMREACHNILYSVANSAAME